MKIAFTALLVLLATTWVAESSPHTAPLEGQTRDPPSNPTEHFLNLIGKGRRGRQDLRKDLDGATPETRGGGKGKGNKKNLVNQQISSQEEEKFTKIYYGKEASPGQFPFMAKLFSGVSYSNGEPSWGYSCGASIIGDRWILTAAHCVCGDSPREVFDPRDIRVYLGEHDAYDPNDNFPAKRVAAVHVHPGYNDMDSSSGFTFDNDIAILYLAEPIEFNDRQQPIQLAYPDDPAYKGDVEAIVAGWGLTHDNSISTLQYLNTTIAPPAACNSSWNGWISENMVCDMAETGTSFSGDSGGPLFRYSEESKDWVQYGAVSWGSTDPETPAYSVNNKVANYRGWIEGLMKGDLTSGSFVYQTSSTQYTGWSGPISIDRWDNHLITITPPSQSDFIVAIIGVYSMEVNSNIYASQGHNFSDSKLLGQLTQGNVTGGNHAFFTSEPGNCIFLWTRAGDDHSVYNGVFGNYTFRAEPTTNAGDGEVQCGAGNWACPDKSKCLYNSQVCDGQMMECFDGSDEGEQTCGDDGGDDDGGNDGGNDTVVDGNEFEVNEFTDSFKFNWDVKEQGLEVEWNGTGFVHWSIRDSIGVALINRQEGLYLYMESCLDGFIFINWPDSRMLKKTILNWHPRYMSITDGNGTAFFNQAYNSEDMYGECMMVYSDGDSMIGLFEETNTTATLRVLPTKNKQDMWEEPEGEVSPDEDYSMWESNPWKSANYFDVPANTTAQIFGKDNFWSYGSIYVDGVGYPLTFETEAWYYQTNNTILFQFGPCHPVVIMVDKPMSMDHHFALDFRKDSTGTVILILRWYGQEVHRIVPLGNYECRKALRSCHKNGYSASLGSQMYRLLSDEGAFSAEYEFEHEENWSGMWDVSSQSLMVNFNYLKYIVTNGSDFAVFDVIIAEKEEIAIMVEKNNVVLALSDCQDPYYATFKMDHSNNNDTFILSLYQDRFQLRRGEDGKVMYELKFSDGKKYSCFPDYKSLKEAVASFYGYSKYGGSLYTIDRVPMGKYYPNNSDISEDQEYDDSTPWETAPNDYTTIPASKGRSFQMILNAVDMMAYVGPINSTSYIPEGVIQVAYQKSSPSKISIGTWCSQMTSLRTFTIPEDVRRADEKVIFSLDVVNNTMIFRANGREVHRLSREDGSMCMERIYKYHEAPAMFVQSTVDTQYRQVDFKGDDDDDKEIDFDLILVNPDDSDDKSQGIVIIKMHDDSTVKDGKMNRRKNGKGGKINLKTKNKRKSGRDSVEDGGDMGVLCNAGAGRNEANAMCRHFGFKYGMFIDPFSFKAVSQKKESVFTELPFFATDLSCPASAMGPESCDWVNYEDSEVPCANGQQLAVSCANDPFEVKTQLSVTVSARGKAKMMCYVGAELYGQEYNTKQNFKAAMMQRSADGQYAMLSDDPKYKKGAFFAKGSVKGMDQCFICLTWVENTSMIQMAVHGAKCTYKMDEQQIWNEIMQES